MKRGSREVSKLASWAAGAGPNASTGSFADAAAFGELLVLAVKGSAAEGALEASRPANLAGKVILDATNPIADKPPVNGVLQFFTNLDDRCSNAFSARCPPHAS